KWHQQGTLGATNRRPPSLDITRLLAARRSSFCSDNVAVHESAAGPITSLIAARNDVRFWGKTDSRRAEQFCASSPSGMPTVVAQNHKLAPSPTAGQLTSRHSVICHSANRNPLPAQS